MKKTLLFTLMLLLGQWLWANTSGTEKKGEPMVSGNVVDATTKKPLAEVTITAINTTSKKEHTITTDLNGDFKISQLPVGTYKFKFQKESYRPTEKNNINVKVETPTKLNVEIINYKDEEVEDRRSWMLKFDF
jgi:5-hydroxyisourate hydrolase-like protein (transthyretin family)